MTGRAARVLLVHGAWHDGSYWEPVLAELAARGRPAVAVDLPGGGLGPGVDAVLAAAEEDGPVVLVGHSLGGLTVPVAAARLGADRVAALLLVAALVPQPGLSWRDRVRAEPAAMVAGFGRGQLRHDDGSTSWPPDAAAAELFAGVEAESSAEVVGAAVARLRPQDWTVTREVCPLTGWPPVRTVQVVCDGDRVVDAGWSRTAGAAIGAEVVELPGGHFPMLTRPAQLAAVIEAAAAGDRPPGGPARGAVAARGAGDGQTGISSAPRSG